MASRWRKRLPTAAGSKRLLSTSILYSYASRMTLLLPCYAALCQVDSIRQEMDEEVSHLLETIQRKSAKLEDTTARLTNRLRWGVAVLQAKNELAIKRQAFSAWRCA